MPSTTPCSSTNSAQLLSTWGTGDRHRGQTVSGSEGSPERGCGDRGQCPWNKTCPKGSHQSSVPPTSPPPPVHPQGLEPQHKPSWGAAPVGKLCLHRTERSHSVITACYSRAFKGAAIWWKVIEMHFQGHLSSASQPHGGRADGAAATCPLLSLLSQKGTQTVTGLQTCQFRREAPMCHALWS